MLDPNHAIDRAFKSPWLVNYYLVRELLCSCDSPFRMYFIQKNFFVLKQLFVCHIMFFLLFFLLICWSPVPEKELPGGMKLVGCPWAVQY